jgi:hypothetical protein
MGETPFQVTGNVFALKSALIVGDGGPMHISGDVGLSFRLLRAFRGCKHDRFSHVRHFVVD